MFSKKIKLLLVTGLLLIGSLSTLSITGGDKTSALDSDFSNGITVDSTLDTPDSNIGDSTCDDGDGNCTLRAAIEESNSNPDLSTINFNISGTPDFTNNSQDGYTIKPQSALPPITEQVTIDGYTQPGSQANTAVAPNPFNGTLLIELDGSEAGSGVSGLSIENNGDSSILIGLIINSFDLNGINVVNAPFISLKGSYIGVDPSGLLDKGNGFAGLTAQDTNSTDMAIGGLSPADRNIMSGNGSSAAYPTTRSIIQGNFIGVGADGLTAIPNSSVGGAGGLSIDDTTGVLVGGEVSGASNVISGNNNHAIAPLNSSDLTIKGNLIGTDYSGSVQVGNGMGVTPSDGSNITIGGESLLARNIISNNGAFGISLSNIQNATIKNNYIGVGANGTTPMGNSLSGIDITDSSNINIGGGSSSSRNIISNNGLGTSYVGANIYLEPSGTPINNVKIQGNHIGVDKNGSINQNFNNAVGIKIASNSSEVLIGGILSNEGNIIAGNQGGIINSTFSLTGIGSLVPNNTAILGNSIYGNSISSDLVSGYIGVGIDNLELIEDDYPPDGFDTSVNSGPTPNDPTDSDTGPNNYINFPILNSVTQNNNQASINFNLDASDSPNNQYRIEFFSNDTADPSGYGEGQTFLGYTTVSNGTNQTANITLPTGTNLANKSISATTTAIDNTTDSGFGSTSEFSPVVSASVLSTGSGSSGLAGTGENSSYVLAVALLLILASNIMFSKVKTPN